MYRDQWTTRTVSFIIRHATLFDDDDDIIDLSAAIKEPATC